MSPEAAQQPRGAARSTRQRRAVREAMTSLSDFISTQDLHAALQQRGDSVSLATTYRVLQSMAEAGEVDVLRNDEGEAIYRSCRADHHHHHLLCRRCGATVELEAPRIERWAAETAAAHGFTQVDHTIEIDGLCPACTAQIAGTGARAPSATDGGPADAADQEHGR